MRCGAALSRAAPMYHKGPSYTPPLLKRCQEPSAVGPLPRCVRAVRGAALVLHKRPPLQPAREGGTSAVSALRLYRYAASVLTFDHSAACSFHCTSPCSQRTRAGGECRRRRALIRNPIAPKRWLRDQTRNHPAAEGFGPQPRWPVNARLLFYLLVSDQRAPVVPGSKALRPLLDSFVGTSTLLNVR